MNKSDFVWKIGGEAGFGIMVTGASFAKICIRSGLNVITNNEYPSLIRGGHNVFTVRGSKNEISALYKKVDLLVALNQQTIDINSTEISADGFLIFDPQDCHFDKEKNSTLTLCPVPLQQLAKDNQGDLLMRNTVALGASLAILGFDFSLLVKVMQEQFGKKGQNVVDINVKTAKSGYDYVINNLKFSSTVKFQAAAKAEKMILSGNEAIALGAISSGVKFFSAYPMTPINGLITYMANHDRKFQFIYKQPEDEISAINMAIGASYTGVRSMTASSGGGFALMNEAFSMAGMTETPLVVIYGQRPGPASGLPTWTSQGDLKYALNAGHGEFLRFVFAPGDTEEAYWLTKLAFNLSDKYQTPAMILVDKYLCECLFSQPINALENTSALPKFQADYAKIIDRGSIEKNPDEKYQRYQINDTGISPRAFPGNNVLFTVNSYEHNESGQSTEIAEEITAMIDKRLKKAKLAEKEAFGPMLYGPKNAETTLVGWGSTKMAALEAINILNQKKANSVNYLHFPCLLPFPVENTAGYLTNSKRVVDVELNSTGQFASLVREKTGILINEKILKYNGRQFYPEDIINYFNK